MSFLEGIDLSDAAKRALIADLELRRNDPRNADRFFRYAYQGGADLCVQHGQFWPGRVRPERYEQYRGEIGTCYHTAREAAVADPRLTYVEGYCTAGASIAISHGWCVDDEGVVDLVLPCGVDQIAMNYRMGDTGLPFMHPTKWGYHGVRFTTELVSAHYSAVGLPMLDRSRREALEARGREQFSEGHHDWPILQVPYDPNRTEMPPWHKPKPPDPVDDWEDEDETEPDYI